MIETHQKFNEWTLDGIEVQFVIQREREAKTNFLTIIGDLPEI